MAQFGGMVLTNAGRNVLAKALTGKTLKFTRAWAGDGYLPENPDIATMTQVINPHIEMEIEEISIPPHIGTAKITVVLSNKELQTGFFLREIGLFAEDPDTLNEVLYGYCNSADTADFMPGYGGADTVYYRFDLTVIIDQAQNVTAIFSDNPLAVTHQQLDDRSDEIYKHVRKIQDFMQSQINSLAQASIINSLNHMGQKHWQG